jgi:hypothetical protein
VKDQALWRGRRGTSYMDPTICTVPSAHFPAKGEANLPAYSNSRPFREGPLPQYQLTRCAVLRRPLAHLAAAHSSQRLFLIKASTSWHKERRAVFVVDQATHRSVVKAKISYDFILFERWCLIFGLFGLDLRKKGL